VPAYIVIHNRIVDDEAMQSYIPKAVESMRRYGVEVLVLSESSDVIDGSTDLPRTIILKFDSRDRAEAWYNCAEYQAALPIRLNATEGFCVLVDGFEAAAPASH
jgi:uncharacterized protein (DUF1330 family)